MSIQMPTPRVNFINRVTILKCLPHNSGSFRVSSNRSKHSQTQILASGLTVEGAPKNLKNWLARWLVSLLACLLLGRLTALLAGLVGRCRVCASLPSFLNCFLTCSSFCNPAISSGTSPRHPASLRTFPHSKPLLKSSENVLLNLIQDLVLNLSELLRVFPDPF